MKDLGQIDCGKLRCLGGLFLALAVLSSLGCTVGPRYRKPGAPIKDEWIDAWHPRLRGEPMDPGVWWMAFDDPDLNRMIVAAYEQNLTLRQAGMRVLEARANFGIATGNFFPQTQAL